MVGDERAAAFAAFREKARAFCDDAIPGGSVRLRDPRYREVTERRDPGPGYSSCGDLAHALLEHLGVRERWVNRASVNGRFAWGMNINRLARRPIGSAAGGLSRAYITGETLQTGDIVIVWARQDTTDAHVFVVDSHAGGVVTSWDYGQGPMAKARWGAEANHVEGAKRSRRIMGLADVAGHRSPILDFGSSGGKPIQTVLPLQSVFDFLNPRPA